MRTIVIVGIVLVALLIGGQMMNIYGSCIDHEVGIKAQYKQNKNNYDNYFKKLVEASQVPEMYVNDLKKLYDGAMSGRYGKDGSKAVFQWIQEKNPEVDASLYRQIQQIIEAGRNAFEAEQKGLIDKKATYERFLTRDPIRGFLAKLMGFPKINLDEYDIITSDKTEEDFQKKKSDPIKLR